MAPGAYYLPAELLLECLRATDLPTRLRASHVSRRWRTIALADRRLWDSFSCTMFRDELHQDAMFDKLQAMLERSSPLPFQLRIPHCYCGGTAADYKHRLNALKQFDTRRLFLYTGPAVVFSHLNLQKTELPVLTALDVRDSRTSLFPWTIIILDGDFSSRMLPNLRVLHAHYISFSLNSAPFTAMRVLTCSAGLVFDYEKLFKLCPNLVHVRFNDLVVSMPLPPLSLPRSLRIMELKPERGSTFDIPKFLHHLTVARLPRLIIQNAGSLQGVIPLFVAMHPSHRIELRLHSAHSLTLSAVPDDDSAPCGWEIVPSPRCTEFLSSLQTHACERLTSLSVSIAQLGQLLIAQLHCPGLEALELRLNGHQGWRVIQADDNSFFIRVPRLQRVSFSVDSVSADIEEIRDVLSVLRASFRALIVYDADLLESVTLCAPAENLAVLDCADFARFAKTYSVCATT